jgi:hypothetical protein
MQQAQIVPVLKFWNPNLWAYFNMRSKICLKNMKVPENYLSNFLLFSLKWLETLEHLGFSD